MEAYLSKKAVSLEDRRALGQATALLGQSRVASNLNQIAHAANVGPLILTEEEARQLFKALEHIIIAGRVPEDWWAPS